jgi:hypothetical protein
MEGVVARSDPQARMLVAFYLCNCNDYVPGDENRPEVKYQDVINGSLEYGDHLFEIQEPQFIGITGEKRIYTCSPGAAKLLVHAGATLTFNEYYEMNDAFAFVDLTPEDIKALDAIIKAKED